MKKIYIILILIISFSCTSDYLEEVDPARYTEANFLELYQNGPEALVNSIYVTLNNLVFGPNEGGPLLYFDEARGDDLIRQKEFRDDALHSYLLFDFTQDDIHAERAWSYLYEGIFRANYAINKLSAENDPAINKYIGEAYFLRGFYYFTLARWYGSVPIVEYSEPLDFYPEQKQAEEVWERAEQDMLTSLEFLGNDMPAKGVLEGRINKGVAYAGLARLHLYQARPDDNSDHWQKVIDYCEQVIDMNFYELEEEFIDIFDMTRYYNNQTNEFIFPVTFAYGTDNSGNAAPGNYYNRLTRILSPYSAKTRFYLNYWTDPTTGAIVLGRENRGAVAMSDAVHDLFLNSKNEGDKRYNASVLYPSFLSYNLDSARVGIIHADTIDMIEYDIEPTIYKYRADGLIYDHRSYNAAHPWSLIRYADVLLMMAEALNEVNNGPNSEAYQYVNQVRERAGLLPLSGLDYVGFRQAVWEERRLEFLFEGLRVPDLIRTNRYKQGTFIPPDEGALTFQDRFTVIPVPSRELRINKNLVQHPLWR
jgi:hypothetical protein